MSQEKNHFYAKLNAILLGKGQKWLREYREISDENADLQDIVQCSAIGIAGLYYYVGIILKALHLEASDELTISNQGADYDELISGEDCEINGELIGTTSRIHLEGEIKTFEVKELNNLKLFIDAFHKALNDLRISSIAPLQEYNNATRREQLWRYVKRGVEADLLTMTGQADSIRMEPPFILGLKSLLRVLARR
ncbi:hypothetical protein U1Q18_052013 [Sarracenia purpurea var. burkii]